jgi:NADPH-dependent F420 reductase
MRIAIIGGTGREGSALARRWAACGEEIVIGSRDERRAVESAERLNREMARVAARGALNLRAAEEGEIAVLTVPAAVHLDVLKEIRDALRGKLLIDATVSLGPRSDPPSFGNHRSAVERAQELLGPETPVVAAFQNISYRALGDLSRPLDCDVLICGDDAGARRRAIALVERMGVRALDAGPARYARVVEALTALLLELNRRYKTKEAGVRITGLREPQT